jgi:hypothetical protein
MFVEVRQTKPNFPTLRNQEDHREQMGHEQTHVQFRMSKITAVLYWGTSALKSGKSSSLS